MSFLLGNTPLVKFILNHIWNLGGIILLTFASEDIDDFTDITKHCKSLQQFSVIFGNLR